MLCSAKDSCAAAGAAPNSERCLAPPCPRDQSARSLPLAVEPSNLPVALQVLRDGQPLPTMEVQGKEGTAQVALLEGVPAGSSGGR